MPRRLRPVGLDFVGSAPLRLVFADEISAGPAEVFHALAHDTAGWKEWFGAVTLARPTDGGREIGLMGGVRFSETVLASDDPTRYAYRVDTTNAPVVRALAEEWLLSPTAPGGTRVQWTFAVDAPAGARGLLRVARPGLGHAFRDAVRSLDAALAAARG
ncbi:SRPBCC family protein [Streptomyces sp. RB6PN25]|uniref:SRPBCC family protein n=1 Tax=Streptomyces humicola TaxID=2953240 RepID=A0ABT1Q120_9ACTN|nr:SRPBCC family protein [Streptomyces humicola]MCQ4083607.1 SRPBCC family protein [Streptomyces humicola]